MSSETQKILSTDGIPLEESLKKAEKKNKIKAFLLVTPLLLFLIITYIVPIADMFSRSIDDKMVTNMLPKTYKACLLYTSPSPRDSRRSRMPSSA